MGNIAPDEYKFKKLTTSLRFNSVHLSRNWTEIYIGWKWQWSEVIIGMFITFYICVYGITNCKYVLKLAIQP
jgi:hypothetical protein